MTAETKLDGLELRRIVEAARQYVHLDDPNDPYPAELVGQLSRAVIALDEQLDEMGTASIQYHVEYKQRRNEQHAAYDRQRWATVAWLLDRAEQYDNSSGYRALFDELVQDVAEWRHVQCAEAGEYDDMKKRVDRILNARAHRTEPGAAATTRSRTPRRRRWSW